MRQPRASVRDGRHAGRKLSAAAKRRHVLEVDSVSRRLPGGAALYEEGVAGGSPILLLHGVGGGAWSWRPQRAALAASHRLYVWEARGHGAASRVDDAGLADYYVDARQALDAVAAGTGRPAILVGHSMGGLLAIALACDVPASVRGLFLVDPVYADGAAGYGHFGPAAGRVAQFLCAPVLQSIERDGAMSRAISRWMFARAFANRARMEAAWPDQRAQVPLEYPRMLREAFGRPEGFALRNFAGEISQPTFLLEGSLGGEGARFPELVAALRERLGPRFFSETIGGGHYLQLDEPEAVNERLARFARFCG